MTVLLSTVRSTGTRFTYRVFEQAGLKQRPVQHIALDKPLVRGFLYTAHCEPASMGHLEARANDHPLILTMRHPHRTAQSWIRRGWEIGHLFFAMWHNLFYLKERYQGMWLPIDTPDRGHYLNAINKRLDLGLDTDWKPYEKTTVNNQHRQGLTLQEAYDYFRDAPFDFEQFGYDLD